MGMFQYDFEEVPLVIGKTKDGKPQRIAFLCGKCTVEFWPVHGDDFGNGYEWEIDEITLEGVLVGDPEVQIKPDHPLRNYIVGSIEQSEGDRIWDLCSEQSQPDPDYLREMRRDVA